MARKTKEEAEKTRQAIIEAAFIVLAKHGIAKTTLNKVALQAGVTRGAIYWHFEDRDALFLALSDLAMAPLLPIYKQLESSHGEELRHNLLMIATNMLESLLLDQQVQQLNRLSQQWATDKVFMDKYRPLHIERNEQFEGYLESLKVDGILLPHLTPKTACLIFTAFLCGIFEQWEVSNESLQVNDIPEVIKSLDKALFVDG